MISTVMFYVLGVLASTLRPGRFASSRTGTTESAYRVVLRDQQVAKSLRQALVHFFGDNIEADAWGMEKHFVARFVVEQRDRNTGHFIQRQSALRQMRYNVILPIGLLALGMIGVCCQRFYDGWAWWHAAIGIATILLVSYIVIKGLYVAAKANIRREVMYVFTALVAAYYEDTVGNGRTTDEASHEEDAADGPTAD